MRTSVSLSTVIALTLACSQEAASPWVCAPQSVPGGEAQSCTTNAAALTADGPAVDGTTEFDCIGMSDPRCPPASAAPSGGTSDGPIDCQFTPDLPDCQGSTSSSSSGSSGSTSDGNGSSSGGSSSGLVSSSSGGTQDGNGSSGSNNGSSGNPNSSSGSNNGSSGTPNSSSGNSNSSSGNNSSGSSGTNDGASSSSGGSGNVPPPNGSWHCVDKDGERTCRSNTPKCARGYHPAACGACVPDGSGDDDCVSPTEGGCWITGGGFIEAASVVPRAAADGNDNFGGNAKAMKRGGLQGHWNHVDHGTGHHLDGDVQYLVCRHANEPGPSNPGGKKGFDINVAYFGGPARFQVGGTWEEGYWYDVEARDHGEPGSSAAAKKGQMADTYNVTIRKQADVTAGVSGVIVYQTGASLSGGNIQIHPPNQGHPTSTSQAPAWVTVMP